MRGVARAAAPGQGCPRGTASARRRPGGVENGAGARSAGSAAAPGCPTGSGIPALPEQNPRLPVLEGCPCRGALGAVGPGRRRRDRSPGGSGLPSEEEGVGRSSAFPRRCGIVSVGLIEEPKYVSIFRGEKNNNNEKSFPFRSGRPLRYEQRFPPAVPRGTRAAAAPSRSPSPPGAARSPRGANGERGPGRTAQTSLRRRALCAPTQRRCPGSS